MSSVPPRGSGAAVDGPTRYPHGSTDLMETHAGNIRNVPNCNSPSYLDRFGFAGIPSTNGDSPATQRELPATQRELPATQRELPATQRELPATQRELPATQRELPATQRELPASQR